MPGGGSPSVKVKRTAEEKEAQRLYVESLRRRNQFLPFLMQDYGFGTDPSGNLSRLPKTAQQQGIDDLALSSLGGAQQAADMMQGRLNLQQSMLPGLLHSVQASMAPGSQAAGLPALLSMRPRRSEDRGNQIPDWAALLSSLSQQAPPPQGGTTPPPGPTTGPNAQFFAGVPSGDTVSETLKELGYGKKQRKAMPLSTMLSLMGANPDTTNPLLSSLGIDPSITLKDFFGGAPFNTNQYNFTLDQILQLLQGQGGG